MMVAWRSGKPGWRASPFKISIVLLMCLAIPAQVVELREVVEAITR
jgi:hypothetical protein